MTGYDDLDRYNGDAEHDMMADFDYHVNTDELTELFDDDDIEDYVNNVND